VCGIVGTIRSGGSVVEDLVEGLRVLEYRGYDSSGVAVAKDHDVLVCKRAGRLERLREALADGRLGGATAGIGHTRWATHGPPNDLNAHPHTGTEGALALVHNGILENYLQIKEQLVAEGVTFRSETDTEVLAHLVERERNTGADLASALRKSLARMEGYYAVAVLANGPDGPELVCARQGPPLAVTVTSDAAHLASDPLGLLPYSAEVQFLEDGDVATLRPGSVTVTDLAGHPVTREARHVDVDPGDADRGTYPHYMLKEIHEQPDGIARTAFDRMRPDAGDFAFEGEQFDDAFLRDVSRVQVAACGTALHAGYITRYLIEGLSGVPVDIDYASEFR